MNYPTFSNSFNGPGASSMPITNQPQGAGGVAGPMPGMAPQQSPYAQMLPQYAQQLNTWTTAPRAPQASTTGKK